MAGVNPELWRFIAKEARSASMALIKFFCCLHVTRNYLLDVSCAPGPSMLPTLNIAGDILLIDRISPRLGKIDRGDIVIVCSPENPNKLVTKRLISVEDDTVSFLADPNNSDTSRTIVVPKGHIWVQGDNIYASTDSRKFGPVPYGLLYGKAFWRVWPIKNFGPL